jgi:predicted metal-dependent hydrolase
MNTAQKDRTSVQPDKTEYNVQYRRIRYPRLEFKTGRLVLVLPVGYKDEASLVKRHERWINRRIDMINKALNESKNLTVAIRTDEESRTLIKDIVQKYEELQGKSVNKLYFRRMNSKWASYSVRRNITINTMMYYLPEKLISYVLFHELTHSTIRKHNSSFWKHIEKSFSDHDDLERQLFSYWFFLLEGEKLKQFGRS